MRIGIIGGGESGVGAALLAKKVGDEPFVSDYGTLNPVYRQNLIENNVRFEENGHNFDILSTSDIIVKSPGVRDETPIIIHLKKLGLTIISELEYGARHCRGKIIAITGSNGKTTTTNLMFHILQLAGFDVVKGGNIGISLSRLLLERTHEIYVIEVSSFQLDNIKLFKPDIAVILNITPDHLDRYDGNFELYADSKLKISENQDTGDLLIYNKEDSAITSRLENNMVKKIPVSVDRLRIDEFSLNNPFLRGIHNQFNASCCIEVARFLKVSRITIQNALDTFKNDKHRLETVAKIDGIEWINDSKATNVDAAFFALEAIPAPIIWIAGGTDKGNDYSKLEALVKANVKVLICLGRDNSKLQKAFGHLDLKIEDVQSMDTAIEMANVYAKEGDTVLLSPACASFDLFENYQDRGSQFISGVWKLLRKRT